MLVASRDSPLDCAQPIDAVTNRVAALQVSSQNGQPTQPHLPRVRSHALFLEVDEEPGVLIPKKVDFTDSASPDLRYSHGYHSAQGKSAKMEDRVVVQDWSNMEAFKGRFHRVLFMAVLDGHAGTDCVNYLEQNLPQRLLSLATPAAAPTGGAATVAISSSTPGSGPGRDGADISPLTSPTKSSSSPYSSYRPGGHMNGITEDKQYDVDENYDYHAGTTGHVTKPSIVDSPLSALREALMACERELLMAEVSSGSTALLALMLDDHLYLANVGDCRAVVCDDGEARQLTRDHKPGSSMERARLEAVGAQLSTDGYVQVTHEDGTCLDIAVTRNIGCAALKRASSGMRLAQMHGGGLYGAGTPTAAGTSGGGGLPPRCPSTSSMHSQGSPMAGGGAGHSYGPMFGSARDSSGGGHGSNHAAGTPPRPPSAGGSTSSGGGHGLHHGVHVGHPVHVHVGHHSSPHHLHHCAHHAPHLASGGMHSPSSHAPHHLAAASGASQSLAPGSAPGTGFGGGPSSAHHSPSQSLLAAPHLAAATSSFTAGSANGGAGGGGPGASHDGGGGGDGMSNEASRRGSESDQLLVQSTESLVNISLALPAGQNSQSGAASASVSASGQSSRQNSHSGGVSTLARGSSDNYSQHVTHALAPSGPLSPTYHPTHHNMPGMPPLPPRVPSHSSGTAAGAAAAAAASSTAPLHPPPLSAAAPSHLMVHVQPHGSPPAANGSSAMARAHGSDSGNGGMPSSVFMTGPMVSPSAFPQYSPGVGSSGGCAAAGAGGLGMELSGASPTHHTVSGQQAHLEPRATLGPTALHVNVHDQHAGGGGVGSPGGTASGGMMLPPSNSSSVLIPDPELFHYAITQDSEFLVLACDGVWDVMRNAEAVRTVRRLLCDGTSAGEAAQALCERAITLGSHDNVTAVLLRFSDRPLPSPATNSVLRRAPSSALATPK